LALNTEETAVQIASQKDFFSGLMFTLSGAGFAWGATNYSLGDGARMGPGYFPMMLGIVLALIGVAVTVMSLRGEPKESEYIGSWAWRPLGYIIGANVAFGICLGGLRVAGQTLIPSLGLIVGIYVLVLIASKASSAFRLRSALINATVLAVGCYLVFLVLLKLQIPLWPAFLSR
jgi:Tripartite tricarboxylate transporter TctB family